MRKLSVVAGGWGLGGKGFQKVTRKLLEVTGMFITLSVMMVHECMHMLKLKVYTSPLCGLLFLSYTSIKLLSKKKSPPIPKILKNISIFLLRSM